MLFLAFNFYILFFFFFLNLYLYNFSSYNEVKINLNCIVSLLLLLLLHIYCRANKTFIYFIILLMNNNNKKKTFYHQRIVIIFEIHFTKTKTNKLWIIVLLSVSSFKLILVLFVCLLVWFKLNILETISIFCQSFVNGSTFHFLNLLFEIQESL